MSKTITVSGYPIEIKLEKPTSEDAEAECEGHGDGTYTIRVPPDLPPRAFVDAFVHELIEAFDMIYSLDLNHTQIQVLGVALTEWLDHENSAEVLRAWLEGKDILEGTNGCLVCENSGCRCE
jgi:hypothetical protein